MKKINYKKLLVAVLWIVAIAGVTGSLAFVSKSERNVVVKNLNISIHNNEENLFLSEKDVKDFLAERNENLVSESYKNISIPQVEKALNSHPAIENAEVCADMNGEVKINVTQRTPVCRIINMDGESYYIDSQSKLMPLNDNYSARVIVASGNITEPYSRRYQYSVKQIKDNKLFKEISILDDVYDVVEYIQSDSLLTSLIHQVYVNDEKELELFPAVGNHKIIFGNTEHLSEKFNKLKLFYTQGLNKSDSWNKYSTINLKYKNLVVCTKK
ncbi:MAG: cell division protein FtsQ/DivIB [Bacteroidia bacterium]